MKLQVFSFIAGITFVLSCIFIVPVSAQDDDRHSRVYETGRFDELFFEGAFGVELIQGNSSLVEVMVADPKAFDYLKISNQDGLLHVHVDRKPFDFSRITIYVTFESLTKLRIYGSVRLETRGYLDLKNLEMLLEGGARVKLQAKANEISIENKGGVVVELQGVADVLHMRLAGAGHINADELKARDVDFRIDGVGTGRVYATRKLNATIKGAGKIRYSGDPEVTESIDGLGSVSRN